MEHKIIVPENQVYDNVGHGNPGRTFTGWKDGSIGEINIGSKDTIYIDTVAPTVKYEMITSDGCYKAEQEIKGKIYEVSEDIKPGTIKYKFGNSETTTPITNTTMSPEGAKVISPVQKMEFSTTVKSGENGVMQIDLNNFTDYAGNLVSNISYTSNVYADTTPPTVEVTSQNLDDGIVQYNFTLNDNSDSYGLDINKKGLASNTFTLDDIMISNGQIAKHTNDGKGNIQTIEVLSNQDGNQRIYIGAGKFSDIAGNLNDKEFMKTVLIDTKAPQIYSVEKSLSTWTNKDVQLTVFANDDGSGIDQYSFDNGQNWQDSNIYTIEENKEVTIKVKDKKGNIASQTIKVNNIDKTVPTLDLTKTENNKESATIAIKGSDNESGILKCSINGIDVTLKDGTYKLKVTENGNYIVTVYDKAENSTTKEIQVSNIDNTEKVDATIIYKNNGGKYTIFKGKSVNISETVYVVNSSIEKIEYAWTQSEKQPTQWTNAGNTSGVKMEKEVSQEGSYYLYVKVTDQKGHETISHSNAFVVKLLKINLDESIDAKNINGVNYIILSKETKANELIGKITSDDDKYTIKIKNSDCTEDVTDNIKTGDVLVAEGEENYKLYKIVVKGDINKDGIIDVSDILQLNQYRLEKVELDEEQKIVADVDENNEININDIFIINKYRLGKIENF